MFYSSIVVFIENSTFSKAIQEERGRGKGREKKKHTHIEFIKINIIQKFILK